MAKNMAMNHTSDCSEILPSTDSSASDERHSTTSGISSPPDSYDLSIYNVHNYTLDTSQGSRWKGSVLAFVEASLKIRRENIEEIISATPFQQDMCLSSGHASIQYARMMMSIPDDVDIGRLRTACYAIAQRLPILRTSLTILPHFGPIQVISQHPHPLLSSDPDWHAMVKDNTIGPPRFMISSQETNKQSLTFYFSHLLLDEKSVHEILNDIGKEYDSPGAVTRCLYAFSMPQPSFPMTRLEDYWVSQVSGGPPQDFPRTSPSQVDSPSISIEQLHIELPTLDEVPVDARTLIHAALAMVIGQHSGSEDVIYGSLCTGRSTALPKIPAAIGQTSFFIPFRAQLHGSLTVSSFLQDVQATLNNGMTYGPVSIQNLRRISPEVDAACRFQTLLAVRDISYQETIQNSLNLEPSQNDENLDLLLDQYHINILARFEKRHWAICVRYDESRIQASEMGTFLDQLTHVLAQLSMKNAQNQLLGELELLSALDERKIRDANNYFPQPSQICVHHLISKQVEVRPDAIAVYSRTLSLTFAQLEIMSTKFAHHLSKLGVGRGRFVALHLEKTVLTALAVLGVLKSGGAFVFLEPSFPYGRLEEIVSQAKPAVIVSSPRYASESSKLVSTMIVLDQESLIDLPIPHTALCAAQPDDIAYVTFTSGSTGKPKGVMHTHQNLSTYSILSQNNMCLNEDTRLLHHVSYSFVVVICDFIAVLAAGGCLCIVDADYIPGDLATMINELDINTCFATPSTLRTMSPETVPSLRVMHCGGEQMGKDIANKWAGKLQLINSYGSTEVVGASVAHHVRLGEDFPTSLANAYSVNMWIADANNHDRLAPIGSVGEILFSGPVLALGYLHDTQQTSEAFVKDPIWAKRFGRENVVFYKTGDLGRYNSDLSIQWVGRKTATVKLRGQRLDLNEIEFHLRNDDDVRHAIVLLPQSGLYRHRLVALCSLKAFENAVANSTANPLPCVISPYHKTSASKLIDVIANKLCKVLPPYMVPEDWILVEAIPLLASRKLNRVVASQWVSNIDKDSFNAARTLTRGHSAQQPSTNTQRSLQQIWGQALGIPPDEVDLACSFMALGGDSLSAMNVVVQARKLALQFTLSDILQRHSIEELAVMADRSMTSTKQLHLVESIQNENTVLPLQDNILSEKISSRHSDNVEDFYGLSSMQRGLALSQLKSPESTYKVSVLINAKSSGEWPVDIDRFVRAWQQVIERHTILRTTFVEGDVDDDIFRQLVLRTMPASVSVIHLENELDVREAWKLKTTDSSRLSLESPHKLTVYQTTDNRLYAALELNHIIFDAESNGLMLRDWEHAYNGDLPPGPAPAYRAYIDYMTKRGTLAATRFWKRELDGLEPTIFLSLPGGSKSKRRMVRTAHSSFEKLGDLLNITKRLDLTIGDVIKAAWALVLRRYLQRNEVCFGYLASGRDLPIDSVESIVGPLINMITCRVNFNTATHIRQVLEVVHDDFSRALPHQMLPLANAVELAGHPTTGLFNTILSLQPISARNSTGIAGLELEVMDNFNATEFDIAVIMEQSSDKLNIRLNYSTSVFSNTSISHVAETLSEMLSAIIDTYELPISEIPTLGAQDLEIIKSWNEVTLQTVSWCVHHLIQRQAAEKPHATAISAHDGSFTYGDLNQMASKLARHLIILGVGRGSFVPLYFEKSKWFSVSLLAVLMAGGAFVPLDAESPHSRLKHICQQTNTRLVLSSSKKAEKCSGLADSVVIVCTSFLESMSSEHTHFPHVDPADPAYIIYTSGSTGAPKGAIISHQAYCSAASAHRQGLHIKDSSRILQFADYSFDTSIEDHLTTFIVGGTLCVPSEEERRSDLSGFMRRQKIDWAHITPSLATHLENEELPYLKVLALGGERMMARHVDYWSPKVRLINLYGPSEACVTSTINEKVSDIADAHNIGRGVGCLTWVVNPDDRNQLLPIGSVGELLIEGPIVADGYLQEPEKTTQAFISPPQWRSWFNNASESNSKLYATGDLVRYNFDGTLSFLGRKDTQVKLRGQRLELQEIEHALLRYRIKYAICLLPQAGPCKDRLVAIFSSKTTSTADRFSIQSHFNGLAMSLFTAELREFLSQQLPLFMIPDIFIAADCLPVLPSQKLDRRRTDRSVEDMSQEQYDSLISISEDVGSHNQMTDIERNLVDIWSEVLNVPTQRIGRNTSFMMIGGDSISAIRVMGKARSAGMKVSVQEILRRRTISEIAKLTTVPIPDEDQLDHVPDDEDTAFILSPIQRLHFHFGPAGNSNNQQSFLFEVAKPMTESDLSRALEATVRAHGMLRARFTRTSGGTWTQKISSELKGHFQVQCRSLHDFAEIGLVIRENKDAINFQNGPLLATELVDVLGKKYLFMTIHHLVIDLVSWRVMLEDLEAFLVKGCPIMPEQLSFQKWAIAQSARAENSPTNTTAFQNLQEPDYDYWGMVGQQNLYQDVLEESFILDEDKTHGLLGVCNYAYRTDSIELFLAALLHSFAQVFSDRELPAIFNEGHGREPWSESIDLSRTIGWFTTMYPVSVMNTNGLMDTIRKVKDTRRRMAENGRKFFADLFHRPDNPKSAADVFPVEVVFNYLGAYQQFEREDSMFRAKPLPVEAKLRDSTERLSLFTVIAVSEQGKLRFTLEYCRHVKQRDSVRAWMKTFEACLCSLHSHLLNHPVRATLSDFDLLSITYEDMDKLHQDVLPLLNIDDINDIEDIYPASPMQEGLIISQLKSNGSAYRQYFIFEITTKSGSVDVEQLGHAWQAVVQRHPILRTVFVESISQYHMFDQIVFRKVKAKVSVTSCSQDDNMLQLCKERLALPPLRFGEDPAHHLSIFTQTSGLTLCCLEKNHLLSDGTSSSLLFNDLINQYESTGPNWTTLPPSYRKYIEYIESKDEATDLEYWRYRLDGIQPSSFPRLNTAVGGQVDSSIHRISFTLAETDQMQKFCRRHDLTSSNVLQMAWSLVLRSFIGADYICFGYLSSGRDLPVQDADKIIGPMINMLLCTSRFESSQSILEAIRTMQEDFVESLTHQTTSLSKIIQASQVSGDLFNTIMSYQRIVRDGDPLFGSENQTSISLLDYRDETEYDISLSISEGPRGITVDFDYRGYCLSQDSAWNVARAYQTAVLNILLDPSLSIRSLDLLSSHDKTLIEEWNKERPVLNDRCLHRLLRNSFQRHPDELAIYASDGQLTYNELDTVSSRLAHHLIKLGVKPEVIVPLLFEKSMWTTVAMLAVIKAGGAFAPLDPAHPRDRIQDIIIQTNAQIILSSAATFDLGNSFDRHCVLVGPTLITTLLSNTTNISATVSPSNALYVVFTSGSTGRPKGIVIEHQAFSSIVQNYCERFHLNENSRILQFASYAFDTCLQDTFSILHAGGCLCVPSDEVRMSDLPAFAREARITFLETTPSFATTLSPEDIPTLDVLSLTGEPMTPAHIATWADHVHLVNGYGPSECCPTSHISKRMHQGNSPRNIGHGVGVLSWVVDPAHVERLVPIGAIGELVLDSPSLARGYLNQPALTSETFIPAPSWHPQHSSQIRLYKTGDLVRYDIDGSISYIGRRDTQVKLRGQRIELDEIEVALAQYSSTKYAAVLLPDAGPCEGKLVAILSPTARYYETPYFNDRSSCIELSSIYDEDMVASYVGLVRSSLRNVLPPYMVPNVWIAAKTLPLLLSGKLDRRSISQWVQDMDEEALQKIINAAKGADSGYQEPQSKSEYILHDLWLRVLHPASSKESLLIGRDDNFFHFGGDSMAAIQLVACARKDRISLSFQDIFDYPKLRDQAEHIRILGKDEERCIEPFELLSSESDAQEIRRDAASQCGIPLECILDMYPCTDLQAGLIGLSVRHPGTYVLRNVYSLPRNFDRLRFQRAWAEVVHYSPILRTRIVQSMAYKATSHSILQVVTNEDLSWVRHSDLQNFLAKDSETIMTFGTRLLRLAFVEEENRSYFVVTMHHALYDGWSWDLLWRMIRTSYQGSSISSAGPGFNEFVGYLTKMDIQSCHEYWKNELQDADDLTFPKLPSPSYQPATDKVVIHEILLSGTRKSPAVQSITMPSIIRATWSIILSRHIGDTNFTYGVTVSGREAEVPGIAEINGPTFCTVPIRTNLDTDQRITEFLAQVQKQSLDMVPFQHFGLQNISRVGPSARRACKFTCIIVIQPQDDDGDVIGDMGLVRMNEGTKTSLPHALVIECAQHSSGLRLRFQYDSSVMSHDTVNNMVHQFEHVLRQLFTTIREQVIRDISFVSPHEKQLLLAWNNKKFEYHDRCIHHDVEEQVKDRPHAQAVHSWDGDLTYDQLDGLASHLASQLTLLGVGPEIIVPICIQRSKWAIVARLAVFKAGGAFVSLNSADPEPRLQALIQRVAASVVLTSQECQSACQSLAKNVIQVDLGNGYDFARTKRSQQKQVSNSKNSAVILFTSGSTGEPKGVVLEHGHLLSSMRAHGPFLGYGPTTRVLHVAGYTWDASIEEIFCTLIHGGTICIPTENEKMTHPTKVIQELTPNWINVTPSFARLIKPELVPSVQTMVFGGEKLSAEDLQRWPEHVRLVNGFGPTECSIFCTLNDIKDREAFTGTIGHPVGCRTWVVDSKDPNTLCPIGAVGELLIEGPIVTRGYYNDESLTRKSYITNPKWAKDFDFEDSAPYPRRFYRSGDHVKYNSDGSFEFVGRIDAQAKLHGQRLEIEEIEHHMRRCVPRSVNVAASIISPKDKSSRKMLVAFLSFDDRQISSNKTIDIDTEFKRHLLGLGKKIKDVIKDKLPPYMVPVAFLPLNRLPLNRSGKLARDELRRIGSELEMASIISLSGNKDHDFKGMAVNERVLQMLWSKTLDLDPSLIGRNDGFVQLGGDSFAAMLLTSYAQEEGFFLSYTDIFRNPKLKDMAEVLSQHQAQITPIKSFQLLPLDLDVTSLKQDIADQCSISADLIEDIYPCTALQEGLLTLTAKEGSSYVERSVYRIPEPLDLSRFKEAWEHVIENYPVLRSRIVQHATGGALQVVTQEPIAWSRWEGLQSYVDHDNVTRMGFSDRLLRFSIVTEDESFYFVMTCHHSIYDLRSMDLTWEAVEEAYHAKSALNRRSDFRRFIQHIISISETESLAFWREQMREAKVPTFPEMACGYQPSADMILRRNFQRVKLPKGFENFTMSTVIRAAWSLLISQYSSMNDVSSGLTLTGRDIPVPGVDKLIGPTFTTVPLRIILSTEDTLSTFLTQLQDQALRMVPYQHVGLQKISRISAHAAAVCNFRSLLVIQPSTKNRKKGSNLGLRSHGLRDQTANFYPHALVMECILHQDEVSLQAWVDSNVISPTRGNRILRQFEHIIHELCHAQPSSTLSNFRILCNEEQQEIVGFKRPPPTIFTHIPASGVSAWIVEADDYNVLLPIGCVGELLLEVPSYTSNIGSKLYSEPAFVPRPLWMTEELQNHTLRRLPGTFVKTGLLYRYDCEGNFVYISRKSRREFILGQPVLLDDVENILNESIKTRNLPLDLTVDTIMLPSHPRRKALAAFVTPIPSSGANEEEWLAWLEEVENMVLEDIQSANVPHLIPDIVCPLISLDKGLYGTTHPTLQCLDIKHLAYLKDRGNLARFTEKELIVRRIWSQVLAINEDKLNARSHFVRLGGDSISAMRVVAFARASGYRLEYADALRRPTLADVAKTFAKVDRTPKAAHIEPFTLIGEHHSKDALIYDAAQECGVMSDSIEDIMLATPLQQGMMTLSAVTPGAYSKRDVFKIPSSVDLNRLKRAWESVYEAHSVLRSRIIQTRDNQAYLVVIKEPLKWHSQAILRTMGSKSDPTRRFTIGSPLVRLDILTEDKETYLVSTIHHSVYDGWSWPLLQESLYQAYHKGNPLKLPNFNNFVDWIVEQQSDLNAMREFWAHEFSTTDTVTFPSLPMSTYQATATCSVNRIIRLRERTPNAGFTLSTLVRAVWALVLAQYTQSNDVVFGCTTSGRDIALPGIERVLGATFTTTPVRVRLVQHQSVRNFLEQVQEQMLRMIPFQHTGLQNIMAISSEVSTACKFNNLLVINPETSKLEQNCHDLGLIPCRQEERLAFYPHPWVMDVTIVADGIDINAQFDPQIVGKGQAARIVGQFEHLLQETISALAAGDCLLDDIELSNPADLEDIFRWNSKEWKTRNACVHTGIMEIASNFPDSPAIDAWDGSMTYKKLTDIAMDHARRLRGLGVTDGSPIPVCFEKSMWAAVSMLAVLMAGGACVTIDPALPQARLEAIMSQLQPKVILTSPLLVNRLSNHAEHIYTLPSDTKRPIGCSKSEANTLTRTTPQSPAFIVFTSGSTGIPKGIVLSHQVFRTNTDAYAPALGLGPRSRTLQFSSYNFDVSIGDFCLSLLTGACLCIPSEDQRTNQLPQFIQDFQINHAHLTPSVISLLKPEEVPSLERIISIGEMCSDEIVRKWSEKLVICYGPAETTLWCSANLDISKDTEGGNIGRGLAASIWIVDRNNHNVLLPIGAVGEIMIGGPLLANGYLDKEQTGQAFIKDPSWWPSDKGPKRFYKTGDLAKYNQDGTIQILGRKDTQVKIAGQRIELGEIEYHLRNVIEDGISVAVEVIKEGGNTTHSMLMAFLGTGKGQIDEVDDIPNLEGDSADQFLELTALARSALVDLLPPYSIPSIFVPLGELPLTRNGKLDRRRLQELGRSLSEEQIRVFTGAEKQKRPPNTQKERTLQGLWVEVLKVDSSNISLDDNFFRLGGDSLSAMRLVIAARTAGLSLTVQDIFSHAKLEAMASHLTASDHRVLDDVPPFSLLGSADEIALIRYEAARICKVNEEEVQDVYPVTSAQRDMMQASQTYVGAYIVHWIFALSTGIDLDLFHEAWNYTVERHPMLNTRIIKHAKQQYQVVLQPRFSWVHETDLELYKQRHHHFGYGDDLNAFGIIHREGSEYLLVWTSHHATYDLWSHNLILDEVASFYLGLRASHTPTSEPDISYKHFVKHILSTSSAAMDFWQSQLAGAQRCDLFSGEPRDPLKVERRLSFPRNIASDVTSSTILTAAWGILTAWLAHSSDVTLGVLLTGRNAPVSGIENIVGPTITRIPVRMKPEADLRIREFVQSVQEYFTAVIPYEHTGIEKICEASDDARAVCERFPIVLVVHPPEGSAGGTALEKGSVIQRQWYDTKASQVRFAVECTPVLHDVRGVDIEVNFSDAVAGKDEVHMMLEKLEVILRELGKEGGIRRVGDIKLGVDHKPTRAIRGNDIQMQRRELEKSFPRIGALLDAERVDNYSQELLADTTVIDDFGHGDTGGRGDSYNSAQAENMLARADGTNELLTQILKYADTDTTEKKIVLDLLGGDGLVRRVASAVNIPDIEIITCDASPYMISEAWRLGCPAILQRAEKLVFKAESVDGVLLAYGSHHIPIQLRQKAIAGIYEALKPGGVFVIHDFELGGPMDRWFREVVHEFSVTGHDYLHYTVAEMKGYFAEAGFSWYQISRIDDPIRAFGASADEAKEALGRYLVKMYGLARKEQEVGLREASLWAIERAITIFGEERLAEPVLRGKEGWSMEIIRPAIMGCGVR